MKPLIRIGRGLYFVFVGGRSLLYLGLAYFMFMIAYYCSFVWPDNNLLLIAGAAAFKGCHFIMQACEPFASRPAPPTAPRPGILSPRQPQQDRAGGVRRGKNAH